MENQFVECNAHFKAPSFAEVLSNQLASQDIMVT